MYSLYTNPDNTFKMSIELLTVTNHIVFNLIYCIKITSNYDYDFYKMPQNKTLNIMFKIRL